MVTISTPKYIIKNGTTYAVLVSRQNVITGTKFFFVSSTESGDLLGPATAFKYGLEYNTRSEAIANLPSGFTPYTPTQPGTPVSIQVGAIFSGVQIAVLGGQAPWVLQVSVGGSAYATVGSFSSLSPTNPSFIFSQNDGAINYTATVTGNHSFRVISNGITSNIASIFVQSEGGSGGGGGVQPPAGERILAVGYLHFTSIANMIQTIDEYMARGFNAIYVNNVPFDQYFLTYTDFQNNNEYIANVDFYQGKAWDNWLLPILTHIKNTYPTTPVFIKQLVAMSPWPALQNEPENLGKDPWWPASHSATDQFGFILNNNGSGIRRSPSFASEIARTRIAEWANWMNTRITNALNPGQVRWYSYGTANTVELGFSQEATAFSNSGDQQSALRFVHADYSDAAITSYRQYLQDKYGTIGAVNSAEGTSWASFSVAMPPISASAPQPDPNVATGSAANYYEVYSGQRGKTWAESRIRDIVRFIQALPVISGAERILEPGHIAYSFSHMTMGGAPKLLRDLLGKIKVAPESEDMLGKDIHSDLYNSHLRQEVITELAVFDARRRINNGTATSYAQVLNEYVTRQEQVGCGMLVMITAPFEPGYAEFRDFWNPVRSAQFKSGSIISAPDTSNWPTVNITFEEWSTTPNLLETRFLAAGGSNNNRIKINYQEPTIVGL